MRCAPAAAILLGAWFIMAPPETLNWRCERVQHPEAPSAKWGRTPYRFDTQEKCEALRAELVRRELNPRRREAATAYVRGVEGHWRLVTPLFGVFGLCSEKTWQPLDFFGHTR